MANCGARQAAQILGAAPLVSLACLLGPVGCLHASEDRPARTEAPMMAVRGSFDGQAAPQPQPAYPYPGRDNEPRTEVQVGYATWYGAALAGRRTASGEPFDPLRLTAAHRTLPFGTWVEVTRMDTGAQVRVRITDRGPFGHADRIIDLSRGAAERIDLVKLGVARVEVRVVGGP